MALVYFLSDCSLTSALCPGLIGDLSDSRVGVDTLWLQVVLVIPCDILTIDLRVTPRMSCASLKLYICALLIILCLCSCLSLIVYSVPQVLDHDNRQWDQFEKKIRQELDNHCGEEAVVVDQTGLNH